MTLLLALVLFTASVPHSHSGLHIEGKHLRSSRLLTFMVPEHPLLSTTWRSVSMAPSALPAVADAVRDIPNPPPEVHVAA